MVLSGGGFDDLVSRDVLEEGWALPVLGVSQAQLPLLVAAPPVHGALVGHGEHVHRVGPGRDGHDVDVLEGGQALGLKHSVRGTGQTPILTTNVLPVSGSGEQDNAGGDTLHKLGGNP